MNENGTCAKSDTKLTRGNPASFSFEVVSYRGEIFGPFKTARGENWTHLQTAEVN